MKYYSQSRCKWARFLIVLSLAWVHSAEEKGNQFSPVVRRFRRQINPCQDGNYTVDGKTCCLCAAGQRLAKVCEVKPDDRVCEFCKTGITYNSKPNFDLTCEPCFSCAHHNANLEVKEECTIAKDAVCRCKQGYFCLSEPCNSCNPCKKCEETGVKKSCTGTNDAVCEEKKEGTAVVIPVTIVLGIVVVAVAIAVIWTKKKKWLCFRTSNVRFEGTDGNYVRNSSMKRALLEDAYLDRGGNFSTLIPVIAQLVGWLDMKNIAMQDGFSKTSLDNIQCNNPGQIEEQTISLLMEWEQKHGREAPRRLMDGLLKKNKFGKAQELQGIIQSDRNSRNQPLQE